MKEFKEFKQKNEGSVTVITTIKSIIDVKDSVKINWQGCGGMSILDAETFLTNLTKAVKFAKENQILSNK